MFPRTRFVRFEDCCLYWCLFQLHLQLRFKLVNCMGFRKISCSKFTTGEVVTMASIREEENGGILMKNVADLRTLGCLVDKRSKWMMMMMMGNLFVSQGLCFARVESKHEIRVILYSDYIYIYIDYARGAFAGIRLHSPSLPHFLQKQSPTTMNHGRQLLYRCPLLWNICKGRTCIFRCFGSRFGSRHLRFQVADLDLGVESTSILGSLRKDSSRSSPVCLELLCHDHGVLDWDCQYCFLWGYCHYCKLKHQNLMNFMNLESQRASFACWKSRCGT